MKAAVTRVNSNFSVSKIACCVFSYIPWTLLCGTVGCLLPGIFSVCCLTLRKMGGGWFACLAIVLGCPLPVGATPSVDGSCLAVRGPSHFSLVFISDKLRSSSNM